MKVTIGPYRKNRKIEVKINDYDLWSMAHTICLILLPMFEKFRRLKNISIPCIAFKDPDDHSDASWKLAETKWYDTVDKIIWSLFEIANCNPSTPDFKGSFEFDPEFKMVGATEEEYEQYKKERDLYELRVQEGLDLMGKNLQQFWT